VSRDAPTTGAPTPDAASLAGPLALIAELTADFAATGDVEATLQAAVERIAGHVRAEGAALFMLSDDGAELVCRACTGPVQIVGLRLRADQGIVGRCVQSEALQRVRDVREDPAWEPAVDEDTGFTTRSILCAPLVVQDERLGAIELVNKLSGDGLFQAADERLLEALAASAALALRNARMAAELVERQRLESELEIAAEIQRSMLPPQRPVPFPVAAVNAPARGVSGDFYDFLEGRDGCIHFCVADVSGKGMNAALLMAKTASLFRCIARTVPEPGRILAKLNDEVCETATRGMFVTMMVGRLDPARGAVCLSGAGHEPALLRSPDGTWRESPSERPPLGIVPGDGSDFPEQALSLDGGSLYLFTDGVTESLTPEGGMLGIRGLRDALDALAERPPAERLHAVVERIGERRHDDCTLLVVEGGGR